jgi:hypothetical protein
MLFTMGCSLAEFDYTGNREKLKDKIVDDLKYYPFTFLGHMPLEGEALDFFEKHRSRSRYFDDYICDAFIQATKYGCVFFAIDKRDKRVKLLYVDWDDGGKVAHFFQMIDINPELKNVFLGHQTTPLVADIKNGGDHYMKREGFKVIYFKNVALVFYWDQVLNKFVRVHSRLLL